MNKIIAVGVCFFICGCGPNIEAQQKAELDAKKQIMLAPSSIALPDITAEKVQPYKKPSAQ